MGCPKFRSAFMAVTCAATLVGLSDRASADELWLDFYNIPGGELSFANGDFAFRGNELQQFAIGGHGFGGLGDITGTFAIGTVSGPTFAQTAPVTGVGQFRIDDGFGNTLTSDLEWSNIWKSWYNTADPGGLTGSLSNISYSGPSSTLQALAHNDYARMTLEFTSYYSTGSLDWLKSGSDRWDFTGNVYLTPEPGSLALVLAGVPAIVAWSFSRLAARRANRCAARAAAPLNG